jgi:hypothetical protein
MPDLRERWRTGFIEATGPGASERRSSLRSS